MDDRQIPNPGATMSARSGLFAIPSLDSTKKLRVVGLANYNGSQRYEIGHRDLEIASQAVTTAFVGPH
jgi:hypothetical protein